MASLSSILEAFTRIAQHRHKVRYDSFGRCSSTHPRSPHCSDTIYLKINYGPTVRTFMLPATVTKFQKRTVSVFPSTAANFVLEKKGTLVETMGNALEVKF